ncbi:uncharacterized protein CEXT_259361 [Caerostris extrusa]|uniref:Uncharacterized protein n=1 Tax=Caerostris extrusa TaxID=172846 RepID=A0AAV4TJU4_CAEEX|nr:uncharacterized protein CEXT_259361 [Caerostris extrusa]
MRGIKRLVLNLFVAFFLIFTSGHFALATSSSQELPEKDLETIKVEFTKPVVEALLRFNGFHRKFGVPYLYVKTAITYVAEIAKATGYSPMFDDNDGVEEFALKHLLRMVLPSSPVYCDDVNCIASTIGDILAEIITESGYMTAQVSDHVIKMYAGNLAGNILWRLSRLPDPDSHMSSSLKDSSPELINNYANLLRFLSLGIKNSTHIVKFCHGRGIDDETSVILSSAVCGSRFLGFKLGLSDDLSSSMLKSYVHAKKVLPSHLESSLSSLLISSIVAETVTFNMIKQGYLKGHEDVEEISKDILKMILLGITSSKMKFNYSNAFLRYSLTGNQKVSDVQQNILKTISDILTESETFNALFKTTQIPFRKLETYASSMADGISHSKFLNMSEEQVKTIMAVPLTRTLLSIARSGVEDFLRTV